MYFQSRSPAQRGSPSPQARATSLEDVAAAARATTRSRAAASALDQNGMREVAAALRDERFRTAFFRVLTNISTTLTRLKALHGRDFWAIHADLMGNHRLLNSIDDLAAFLDRILAKGASPRALARPRPCSNGRRPPSPAPSSATRGCSRLCRRARACRLTWQRPRLRTRRRHPSSALF